ncbi:MAG: transpeptidase family protein [Bacteroides sp.]|nr:transpeptidase family protein [Bacteroides sp.]
MAVNKKSIMTRYFFIILLMGVLGVLIVVKAGIIMFAERQYWSDVADRFVRENVVVKPNRGNIISSDGKLMASSLPKYHIYMDFKAGGKAKEDSLTVHFDEICQGLNWIFPDKSVNYFRTHLKDGWNKGSRNYLIYPRRISYSQYKAVKALPVFNMSSNRGGFHTREYNHREKPFGTLAERTLGELYPDVEQGAKNGLELAFDSLLKGQDGITHRKKVRNQYINMIDVPPVDGCDLITTIDVGMQDICEKALLDKLHEINGNVGVVVLMEVETGDVKAIVNMTKGRDGVYREERNNAISDMMEPGSTFKTASLMVALEDGYITPEDGVDTGNGVMMMHKRPMRDHNWRRGGYQYLTVPQILMVSSNIGISYLIDKHYGNNPDKFVEGLHRMSLHEPLNLQIPGEGKPNIRRPRDGRWSKTTLPWMSIGYETQIPPINTLTFYNAIANNGKMVKPRFVKATARNGEILKEYPVEVINPSICSRKTLDQIQEMLELVVSKGLGSAAGSSQFSVSGKTGTAQISQGAGGYKTGTVHYLVSFCGYFPSENPKYSCIVAIQKPGLPASGGLMAGSVFGRIAERIYAKDLTLNLARAIDSTSIPVPDVKPGDLVQANYVLNRLKVDTRNEYAKPRNKEVPVWGNIEKEPTQVILKNNEISGDIVPNVVGMGAKDAVYLLESKGLQISLSGVGKVKTQSLAKGTAIKKGQTIRIYLQ